MTNTLKKGLTFLFVLFFFVLGFSLPLANVQAVSEKPTARVNVDFKNGVDVPGLTNHGATWNESKGSASFDGVGDYMYFTPDVSDQITGSFTVMIGAYLKAQNKSGYIFNTGYYANGVAVELNYNNLRFYFGNDTELAFSLKSVLPAEETLFLITLGYSAEDNVIYYRAQNGTDLANEKSGSAYTSASAPFSHATYSLTLGAQTRAGADTVNYCPYELKTFTIYDSFINDETFIDETYKTLAGIEEPATPEEPTTPDVPSEPEQPTEPETPATEETTLSTWAVVGIALGSLCWLGLFVALFVKLLHVEETKYKVLIISILTLLAGMFFAGASYLGVFIL